MGVSLQFHLNLFSVIVFLASPQAYYSLFIVFTPSVFLLLSQLASLLFFRVVMRVNTLNANMADLSVSLGLVA